MKFVISGNPIPKARARTFAMRGKTTTYDPQFAKKKMVQAQLNCFMKQAFNSLNKEIVMEASNLAYNHAYEVRMSFAMRIPHSCSKKERNIYLWGKVHNQKPDLDNLEKFYADCANGILYPDDAMIISLKSRKYYSENPRTEIDVMPIKKQKDSQSVETIKQIFSPDELKEFLQHVEKFYKYHSEYVEVYQELDETQWISSLSDILVEFSQKYCDTFKKICKEKKKKGDDQP